MFKGIKKIQMKSSYNVTFSLPADTSSPPCRKGAYKDPRPIKGLSISQRIKIKERRDEELRNINLLRNISIVRFHRQESGFFYPCPVEFHETNLPSSMKLVRDYGGHEVLEESLPDGSIVRYRVFSKRTVMNPSSHSLSGFSRLVSFYRDRNQDKTIHVNESHILCRITDNDYFTIWRQFVMDDHQNVLYSLKKENETYPAVIEGNTITIPVWHMMDYFMRVHGISEENALKMAIDIKALMTMMTIT